ncbi:MAG TPA: hypothetical protein VK988_04955 [Acidimicrobiales bacterium]|nr:hypothetical protein [Acidimicrobiales bacterium]
MARAHHSDRVELTPAILLTVSGDDIPTRPSTYGVEAWAAWRDSYRVALGLAKEDVPDGVHIAIRRIDTPRLLDAVIDTQLSTPPRSSQLRTRASTEPTSTAVLSCSSSGSVVSTPTCCVDLSCGIQDWVGLARDRRPDWTTIWTGHPAVLARAVEDTVEVSEQSDNARPHAAARFSLEDFRNAVDQALADREMFASRLGRRLRERGHAKPAETARTIAGLTQQ